MKKKCQAKFCILIFLVLLVNTFVILSFYYGTIDFEFFKFGAKKQVEDYDGIIEEIIIVETFETTIKPKTEAKTEANRVEGSGYYPYPREDYDDDDTDDDPDYGFGRLQTTKKPIIDLNFHYYGTSKEEVEITTYPAAPEIATEAKSFIEDIDETTTYHESSEEVKTTEATLEDTTEMEIITPTNDYPDYDYPISKDTTVREVFFETSTMKMETMSESESYDYYGNSEEKIPTSPESSVETAQISTESTRTASPDFVFIDNDIVMAVMNPPVINSTTEKSISEPTSTSLPKIHKYDVEFSGSGNHGDDEDDLSDYYDDNS